MEIFRLCLSKYANRLTASGRAGRWNNEGEFVIYASRSRSLATLEWAVRRNMIGTALAWKIMVISVPDEDDAVQQVLQRELPAAGRSTEETGRLRERGSEWYHGSNSLILKVPSAVVPQEYNYLINTMHPAFKKKVKLVRKEGYFWDERL